MSSTIKIGEWAPYFSGEALVITDFVQLFNESLKPEREWLWCLVRDEVWKTLVAMRRIKGKPPESLEFPAKFSFNEFHILVIIPNNDITLTDIYLTKPGEEKTSEVHDILVELATNRLPVVITEPV